MRQLLVVLILGMVVMAIAGCSEDGPPGPKKTVISVFGAMDKNDQAALTYHLDLPELMKSLNEDYALQTDSPRVIYDPQEILYDLTGDGQTKRVWFRLQRIVGDAEITGESTATVEVTFVDKAASKGYLTHFGLHIVNGRWKVYSFKTISGT